MTNCCLLSLGLVLQGRFCSQVTKATIEAAQSGGYHCTTKAWLTPGYWQVVRKLSVGINAWTCPIGSQVQAEPLQGRHSCSAWIWLGHWRRQWVYLASDYNILWRSPGSFQNVCSEVISQAVRCGWGTANLLIIYQYDILGWTYMREWPWI